MRLAIDTSRYAPVVGRLRRWPFWIATVIYVLAAFALRKTFGPGLFLAYLMPAAWLAAIVAPRLRDAGQSPWWALFPASLGFGARLIRWIWVSAGHLDPSQAYSAGLWVSAVVSLFMLVLMIVIGSLPSRIAPPPAEDAF